MARCWAWPRFARCRRRWRQPEWASTSRPTCCRMCGPTARACPMRPCTRTSRPMPAFRGPTSWPSCATPCGRTAPTCTWSPRWTTSPGCSTCAGPTCRTTRGSWRTPCAAPTLRGADVSYNPVFLAHALVGLDHATLFVDDGKIGAALRAALAADGVDVAPYGLAAEALGSLERDQTLLIDPARVTCGVFHAMDP